MLIIVRILTNAVKGIALNGALLRKLIGREEQREDNEGGIVMKIERYRRLKKIFYSYGKNKAQLRILFPPCMQGVDYSKVVVKSSPGNGVENQITAYISDKERIEREVLLVDRVYDFFADERDEELAKLIDTRFRRGKPMWNASNECAVSERQAIRWMHRAYAKAEEIAVELKIL